MNKPLLTTVSAVALLFAGAAYAQTDTAAPGAGPGQDTDQTTTTGTPTQGAGAGMGAAPGTTDTTTGMTANGTAGTAATGEFRSYQDDPTALTGTVGQDMSADELIGGDIIDAQGNSVGTVSDLLIDQEGNVNHVLVDVGGFLGMGAHTVALEMDDLTPEMGDRTALVTSMTEDQLRAMPEVQREGTMWRTDPGMGTTGTETGTAPGATPGADTAPGR